MSIYLFLPAKRAVLVIVASSKSSCTNIIFELTFYDHFYVHFTNIFLSSEPACHTVSNVFVVGPKYNPKELFDITRRTGTSGGDGGNLSALSESCLQVQVPCDLIRRSTIAVSIEIG